jgi:hypothetical protein
MLLGELDVGPFRICADARRDETDVPCGDFIVPLGGGLRVCGDRPWTKRASHAQKMFPPRSSPLRARRA